MIDNTIYIRVNAPKEHQRIIGKLMMRLGILYYIDKKIPYEPLPETMIDESKTSPTPDILLFDNSAKLNKVIIEVTGNTGVKKDYEKVKQLMKDYEVPEGYVYNYDRDEWLSYRLKEGEVRQHPSFSPLLNLDLSELV